VRQRRRTGPTAAINGGEGWSRKTARQFRSGVTYSSLKDFGHGQEQLRDPPERASAGYPVGPAVQAQTKSDVTSATLFPSSRTTTEYPLRWALVHGIHTRCTVGYANATRNSRSEHGLSHGKGSQSDFQRQGVNIRQERHLGASGLNADLGNYYGIA